MDNRKYKVILADPPWKSSEKFSKTAGYAKAHYPYMSIDELCALPVSSFAADESILILWVIWPQAENAFRVVNAWGFEYVTGFPWIKLYDNPTVDLFGNLVATPVYGTGAWVRGCSEPVYICKRGNFETPKTHWMGLLSNRLEHSRKPDDIYQYAETFAGPRLEMFARRKRSGWDVFGNEVESDVYLGSLPNNVLQLTPEDGRENSAVFLQSVVAPVFRRN
jgi:N6-adenosine-specific RNA methylase IME4